MRPLPDSETDVGTASCSCSLSQHPQESEGSDVWLMRVSRLRGLRSTWAPKAPKPGRGLLCCDRAPSPGVDFWRVSVFVCVLFFCAFLVLIKNAIVLSLRIVPPTQATRWPLTPNTRLASKVASRQRGPGCDGGGLVSQPPHSWVCCLVWLRGAHNKSSQTLIWPQSQPPVFLSLLPYPLGSQQVFLRICLMGV